MGVVCNLVRNRFCDLTSAAALSVIEHECSVVHPFFESTTFDKSSSSLIVHKSAPLSTQRSKSYDKKIVKKLININVKFYKNTHPYDGHRNAVDNSTD